MEPVQFELCRVWSFSIIQSLLDYFLPQIGINYSEIFSNNNHIVNEKATYLFLIFFLFKTANDWTFWVLTFFLLLIYISFEIDHFSIYQFLENYCEIITHCDREMILIFEANKSNTKGIEYFSFIYLLNISSVFVLSVHKCFHTAFITKHSIGVLIAVFKQIREHIHTLSDELLKKIHFRIFTVEPTDKSIIK